VATKKKATKKKAAKRKATKKKATRKAPARKKKAGKRKSRIAVAGLKLELPATLDKYSSQVRGDLTRLEKQIETARKDMRRRWTRIVRDVSHLLGRLEAEGGKRFRDLTKQAENEAHRALKRLRTAVNQQTKTAKKRVAKARRG
jgi:adenylate kinase/ribonuclease R